MKNWKYVYVLYFFLLFFYVIHFLLCFLTWLLIFTLINSKKKSTLRSFFFCYFATLHQQGKLKLKIIYSYLPCFFFKNLTAWISRKMWRNYFKLHHSFFPSPSEEWAPNDSHIRQTNCVRDAYMITFMMTLGQTRMQDIAQGIWTSHKNCQRHTRLRTSKYWFP